MEVIACWGQERREVVGFGRLGGARVAQSVLGHPGICECVGTCEWVRERERWRDKGRGRESDGETKGEGEGEMEGQRERERERWRGSV
jgi:hypothetical protein